MTPEQALRTARTELETGIELTKCQQCGCMDETLKQVATVLPTLGTSDACDLAKRMTDALESMRPINYPCLGCEHCYPAVASNALSLAFPALALIDVRCDFSLREGAWPPVVGEYVVVDQDAPVAVSTLASVELVDPIVQRQPHGLAIIGKTETENIGIDKVITSVVSNPSLQALIVAGVDPQGHYPGQTLLALAAHGVDANGRVIGSPGTRPVLRNVSVADIQAFRQQVQVIDMIGYESPGAISAQVAALAQSAVTSCACGSSSPPVSLTTVPTIVATEPDQAVRLDKAGYFVIVPVAERGVITVEHYAYDNTLLHVIEGAHARDVYMMLIRNGWVTELSHAAYLGKELAKAELSLQYGCKYVQDGA